MYWLLIKQIMSNDNIDSRIDDVLEQLKNKMEKDYNEKLSKEKEDIINNLLNMFPQLETKKNEIIQGCINNKNLNNSTEHPKNNKDTPSQNDIMVFDEIEFEGEKYYLNQYNGIWNNKAELVGSLIGYDSNNDPIISFFNSKIKKDIPMDLQKILYKQ